MKLKDFIKLVSDRCYMRFIANDCDLGGCYPVDLRTTFKNHECLNRKIISLNTKIAKSDFNDNIAYGELVVYLGRKEDKE